MMDVTSRWREFLVIWLSCLAAGIAAGFLTALIVQALVPATPADEGSMAYGFYVLFWVLGAANVAHFSVAIVVGSRYARQRGMPLGSYLPMAIGFSIMAFVVTMFLLVPLILFNSVVAAAIATLCLRRNNTRMVRSTRTEPTRR
jgi:hypothetical protein